MTPEQFARNEYRDLTIYQALARNESVYEFQKILQELVEHEQSDFEFWKALSPQKEFRVSRFQIALYRLMRRVLGLTFTAKFLEGRERETIKVYEAYLATQRDENLKARVREIIEHERYHERALIGRVEEDRVAFVSNVILGLNDGLIELTGALVGFAFALREIKLVALAGLITGISASLSMASSAFMQARHEVGKSPGKAAFYTGISYLIVVLLLVSPFLLFEETTTALLLMVGIVLLIIVLVSFYSAVLLERSYLWQLGEMLLLSAGVAVISFALGLMLRGLIGI